MTVKADLGGTITQTTGHVFLAQDPENFVYDDDGNLLSDGRFWNYSWDAENRLASVETRADLDPGLPRKRLEFLYDYMGRRAQKKVFDWNSGSQSWTAASDTRFLYDGWNVVAELDGNNALEKTYLWGNDLSGTMHGAGGVGGLLMVSVVGGDAWFTTLDGNGNVLGLHSLNDWSSSTAAYEYGPFGELIRASGAAAALNPFRFSTKYFDSETSLYYYGYRYYSPSMGRWLNRDPINEPGSMLVRGETKFNRDEELNLYAMVGNDPVNKWDLLGLEAGSDCSRLNQLPSLLSS